MSQRSPYNERYKKQNAGSGSTRKSASSAKLKRAAGSYSGKPEKKAPEKKRAKWSEMVPSTPEIKKWRRIWYVLLVVAVASFGLAYWGQSSGNQLMASIGFTVELTAVGIAIAIDLVVIRKLRIQAIKDRSSGKKKPEEATADKSGSEKDAS